MNELTAEWGDKAEADFNTAGRERRVRKQPNPDAVCFHAQQAAEKYLKAFLQEHGLVFPKTHSLIELLELSLRVDTALELQRNTLVLLDSYRYPGESADRSEAQDAYRAAKMVREFTRRKLGLQ